MNLITGDEFTVYVATGNQDMADTTTLKSYNIPF
jgi:hypothetical protein